MNIFSFGEHLLYRERLLMLLGHSHPNALHVLFWSHLPAYDFLLCRQNPAQY